MATIGSNLNLKGGLALRGTLLKKLGLQQNLRTARSTKGFATIVSKVSDTAPADNTAADSPGRKGVFCLHYNAAGVFQHVYLCIAYTDDTTFDWVQVD